MSRVAVAAVLLLAAPAAAQPPPPAPQPIPPFPVLPPQPGQPQNFAVPPVVFSQSGGRVVGGGGSSAPRVVVARVADGALVYSSNEVAPVQQQIEVQLVENGQPVTRRMTTTLMQPQTRDVSLPLDRLKARDAAGKRVQPLALEIRLGKGAGVVLHTGPIPDEIKAMFKADAIFVEVPPGAGGGVMPQPVYSNGFDFVQPAPVPRGAPPADAPVPVGRPLRVNPVPVDEPAPPVLRTIPVRPAPVPPPAPQPE